MSQNRRRGLLSRLQGLIQRALNRGGAAEEPSPPVLREEEPTYEREQFQPLPTTSGPKSAEEEYIYEEETIIPGVVPSTSVEYIPGHYSQGRNGGRYPVYGRYRVSDPQLGDMQDLMNQSGDYEVTVVIVGVMQKYAGFPAAGKDAASYRIDVSRMNYIMQHTPADTMEDAINEYLSQAGDEWLSISEINILNKEDRPQ